MPGIDFHPTAGAGDVGRGPGPGRLPGGDTTRPAMAWSVSGAWIVLAAEPIVGGACGAAVLALLWLRRRRQRVGSVPSGDEVAGLPRSVGALCAAAKAGAMAHVSTKSSALN